MWRLWIVGYFGQGGTGGVENYDGDSRDGGSTKGIGRVVCMGLGGH